MKILEINIKDFLEIYSTHCWKDLKRKKYQHEYSQKYTLYLHLLLLYKNLLFFLLDFTLNKFFKSNFKKNNNFDTKNFNE